jgi:pimeloyl-ACP methyl ester carboxylesterase
MYEFVYASPEVAPAFVLANAGYDVWLGNNRGSRLSLAHETLDPKSKAFWQFTWEELGTYDTPAMIDYILKETGAAKINYIGHSEGTT